MQPVVIFDIEASCEDRKINPHYNMEVIEIGAVKVHQGKLIDTFQTFIEPEYIIKLTDYCEELTGLTFGELKGSPKFAQAILDFYDFIYGSIIYSCGDFDRKKLVGELNEKGYSYKHKLIRNYIKSNHRNLKTHYSTIVSKRKQGMLGMANELEIELEGRHHRGIDDAKNLTKIYLKLEEIRKDELEKTFTDKRMEKIIKFLNIHHKENYEVDKKGENYLIYNKNNDKAKEFNFLSFIDIWSQTLIVDEVKLNRNYLSKKELKVLRKYTVS